MFRHRIAAGGLVIDGGRILLVRYPEGYLVAPGGAIEDGESLAAAAEREVEEETGVRCKAGGPVLIENIRARNYQMVKIWYLCHFAGGSASRTAGAEEEGIVEVGWYAGDELAAETVFPAIVKTMGLEELARFQPRVLDAEVCHADF